jgi:hypothetical protein
VSYSGTSQGAINVGTYTITPGGLYSNQQGYIINDVSGTLSIARLASVAWVGGASGNWSNAANWAGGAIPDFSNVAAVIIPKGTIVTYDSGVPGTTTLSTLTDSGKLVMAAGDLTTTGNLSTAGYTQTGGLLNVEGMLSITSTAGAMTLGNIDAGTLSVTSKTGAITQLAGTALDVTGASSLTAYNGLTGPSAVEYDISHHQRREHQPRRWHRRHYARQHHRHRDTRQSRHRDTDGELTERHYQAGYRGGDRRERDEQPDRRQWG